MKKFMIILCSLLISGGVTAKTNLWEKIKTPTGHEPESIGSYSNGCVLGAKKLPLSGVGYEVIRTTRNRYYGHPDLIDYLQKYGRRIHQAGLGKVLIGDMAMPAGGRFSSGHRSHQSGIDVDIWFKLVQNGENFNRENPESNNVVSRKNFYTNKNWNAKIAKMIKLAVLDHRVARIFVNPAIKRKLCDTEKNKNWLRRLRPWHGHNYHMHVRLKCSEGNKSCKNQNPVKFGSGCGQEVLSWDWRKPKKKSKRPKKPQRIIIPQPPARCLSILSLTN